MTSPDASERLQALLCQIARLPSGDEPVAFASLEDGLDAVRSGIDALYEELDATTLDRERVEQIFDAMSDVVLVVDREGRIIRANLRAQQLLGYTRDQLLGMSIADIVEVTDAPLPE